jgi:hypothetical protein
MAAKREREAVTARVLTGGGKTSVAVRRAAFANTGVAEPARALIDKVANTAWKVTDEDVARVRAAQSDDEIYEQAVAAALGQATRQLDAALAALAVAAGEAGAKS